MGSTRAWRGAFWNGSRALSSDSIQTANCDAFDASHRPSQTCRGTGILLEPRYP